MDVSLYSTVESYSLVRKITDNATRPVSNMLKVVVAVRWRWNASAG